MADDILDRLAATIAARKGADAGSSLHDGDQIKTMFAEDIDRTRVR